MKASRQAREDGCLSLGGTQGAPPENMDHRRSKPPTIETTMKAASMQTSQALGCLVPGLLAAFGLAGAADAPWPDRVISLVVLYPPGGGNDTISWLVAQCQALAAPALTIHPSSASTPAGNP